MRASSFLLKLGLVGRRTQALGELEEAALFGFFGLQSGLDQVLDHSIGAPVLVRRIWEAPAAGQSCGGTFKELGREGQR